MSSRIVIALRLGEILFLSLPMSLRAQQTAEPPTQCHHADSADSHPSHQGMMARGEQGMGFSQAKTTHHFLLKPDGGVIAVSAKDPKDADSRDQIRMHLTHIAKAFAQGDFDIPMFVHDQVPPGLPAMKRLSAQIQYRFKQTDEGGQVSLSSTSPEAITAIHDFLKFQIREHKTGDPVALP